MLEWGAPWWFAALPVVLVAPVGAGAPPGGGLLEHIRTRPTPRSLLAGLPKLLQGRARWVVALARSQEVNRTSERGHDIMLALTLAHGGLDCGRAPAGERLSAAKEVIARLRGGRTTASAWWSSRTPHPGALTTDARAMVALLSRGHRPRGQAGHGCRRRHRGGGQAPQGPRGPRADRHPAHRRPEQRRTDSLVEAAEAMSALGIRVYTIGIAAAGGAGPLRAPDGLPNELDESSLRAIAQLTGGRYFRADDTEPQPSLRHHRRAGDHHRGGQGGDRGALHALGLAGPAAGAAGAVGRDLASGGSHDPRRAGWLHLLWGGVRWRCSSPEPAEPSAALDAGLSLNGSR